MALGSGIRPLNAFYLELQRQLSSEDVTKIKDQLLHSHVDRADYERLKTATQIFQYLEDRGCISTENLTLLSELFLRIRLPHLADQVGEFLENPLSPTLPLRSPLLSPTQRLPSTPLPSPSLVQSSPLQRSPPLPVSQQQQLLPFFEGSVGEKRPQQDYGDQQVAKRLTREHAQEHGALKAAESMIPQPHFVKGKQSMLFVNSDWSNEMHRISILSRLLADVLESEAVDRYATTLEVSDIGFTVDKSGVTVINALESKVDILQNKMPTLDWLINYPNAIYDHMQGIENIRLVVGHMSTGSDEHLHQAGLAVHENMKKSKFFLFNHSIPEGMSVVTPDVEVAAKAEVVFSVGPTVYSHFQTQYHVPPSPKCHICFYPPTSAQLMGLKVKVPSTTGMQRILTFCEVKTTEDFKKYNEIAIAMGKVAEKFHGTKQSVPIWDVMVSTKDLAGKFREHLRKASGSPQLQLYTIPSPSNQSLVVKLQQSVLLVVPEKRDPFNYVAYFAMQAGLPVVVAKRSGMGEFLVELCPLICDAYMVDAGVHDFSTSDADNWRQKIIDNLKNQELSFERAKQVKEALANNDLIRNSTRTFVEYCRSAFQGKDNHAESNQGGDIQAVLPSSDDGEVDGDRRNDSDDSEGVQIHFRSTVWQEKLEKLMAMTDDQHIQHLGDVKLCMTDEFLIARGGHLTEVYVGIDLKKEVEVAVKRIDPKGASIENEVAVMKRVNGLSMNIVELYDHIQPNTIYDRSQYLVMELCEKTLESYIQELSSGSDEETRQIAYRDVIIDFLSGLRTLHKMKIVHRDLKPRNILIDCRGRAKLSDFGISRLLADQTRIHTKKTTAAGTECWESWETVAPLIEGRGEAMYSDKSDIQVAGMLVFYTLTGGIHPYGDMKATIGIAMNIKDEKAINMDKLKDCVARHLVEWMIRKDRKRRPEIDAVLRHAFFWPNEKRFGFLVAVASVLASGQAHILQSEINTSGEKMNIVNWVDKVRTGPYSSIVKDATIGPKAVELLKFMKTCYYADTSVPKHNTTNAAATETPAAYFLETFPDVFLTVYDVIHQSRYSTGTNWTKDEALLQFFSRDEF